MRFVRAAAAVAFIAVAATVSNAGRDVSVDLAACRAVLADDDRLACYDTLARRIVSPRFEGRRNAVTEPFTIEQPHILRFYSEGVIFVLYVKDAAGNVIQNLHIGGGGEDSYRIEKPGTYSLQINGAEGWRIWLYPEETAKDQK